MKAHTFLLLVVLFFSPLAGSVAQKIDLSSLINEYNSLEDQKNYYEAATVAINIGDLYLDAGDFVFAKKFYEKGINDSERTDDINLQSLTYYYAGYAGFKYAEAVTNQDKKNELWEDATRHFKKAVKHYSDSEFKLTENHIMAFYYGGLCLYLLDDTKNAIEPLDKAFRFAQRDKLNHIAKEAANILSKIYASRDEPDKADYYHSVYQNYQEFTTAVDSLEKTKQTNQQLSVTIEEKETELIDRNIELENANLKAERDALLIQQKEDELTYVVLGAFFVLILLLFNFRAYRITKKTKKKLEVNNKELQEQKAIVEKRQKELKEEKVKSERLLLNILPRSVAMELREKGRTKPLFYKKVTVLFTDFKGFTSFAEKRSPTDIVHELDICFNAFDNIIEKYNLEKIKTMGDGYMCAGGVPVPNETNPLDTIRAAMEMLAFMNKRRTEMKKQGRDFFEIRIGIHTGPVVAGVVGKKKFAYDIWGDTVNVAARMESSGEEGKINISGDTFVHVKDKFFFTHRGKIKAKNKGEIDMFFVDGRVKYAMEGERKYG